MIKFVNYKKHKKKNTILVIEDLDRIDPKHLFRILNILSAHIDLENGENNKFGFDKIILVMDYIQTKHIFHHNYGENANYEGYMSKFITTQPFLYDKIIDAAQTKVYEMIGKVVFDDYNKRDWTDTFQNLTRKINNLSVRDCVKITKFNYQTRIISNTCKINERLYSTELPLFKLILLMIEIGLSKKEIMEDFNLYNKKMFTEYFTLIFPIINNQQLTNQAFFYKKEQHHFATEMEKDVIIKIYPSNYYLLNSQPSITDNDINDNLEILLNNNFNGTLNLSTLKKY
jgi:hypothetical protein